MLSTRRCVVPSRVWPGTTTIWSWFWPKAVQWLRVANVAGKVTSVTFDSGSCAARSIIGVAISGSTLPATSWVCRASIRTPCARCVPTAVTSWLTRGSIGRSFRYSTPPSAADQYLPRGVEWATSAFAPVNENDSGAAVTFGVVVGVGVRSGAGAGSGPVPMR